VSASFIDFYPASNYIVPLGPIILVSSLFSITLSLGTVLIVRKYGRLRVNIFFS